MLPSQSGASPPSPVPLPPVRCLSPQSGASLTAQCPPAMCRVERASRDSRAHPASWFSPFRSMSSASSGPASSSGGSLLERQARLAYYDRRMQGSFDARFHSASWGATPKDFRILPARIILVRHAQSEGNVDNKAYASVPDSKIPITGAAGSAPERGLPGIVFPSCVFPHSLSGPCQFRWWRMPACFLFRFGWWQKHVCFLFGFMDLSPDVPVSLLACLLCMACWRSLSLGVALRAELGKEQARLAGIEIREELNRQYGGDDYKVRLGPGIGECCSCGQGRGAFT